ncbi:MarR family winged helix-turn-helix transcriptional regulator [Streptomyces sp. Qhu_M48]|uniref:MarR family winged helix-turn-helix transcriptional regulator n=1 Tax=Streptomyces sp. Qhu_M48 TaxID=3435889 RepID=UPI003F50075C
MAAPLDLDRHAGHLIRRAEQVHTALWTRHVSSDVTSQQFAVLNALRAEADIDQSTVARLTSLDRSTTHLIVRRLTGRLCIRQRRDEDDRRRTLLALTDQGVALHPSLVPPAQRINDWLLAVFVPEEQAEVMRLLMSLADLEAGAVGEL